MIIRAAILITWPDALKHKSEMAAKVYQDR